ncbi:iron ABC transporter permease [Anabaena cylindrica FACHB-243]|uniref:ABC-type transporter, integral membrane subunit n=1 Tax=Anabaena cylindrica (strain ATCC 27899 / PCC 7122) TaxID=272123 RepID=K9ZPQ3_ANACC|nr:MULTISPECIES: iron ABC transporter permease [Anabaena]AFZ60320.1 ABC-type transporter, integral membrane subunit [Anabaena cylindrica PCC 7122]MBD2418953.1 iron ABC transporter permease [Anabaena cylindrica FACHB-243]MBY5282023.1 iron ABC transporter permease [Anabaena sp. CCAP 1446/1C]MBY5308861.1 iron ABC transporter permease [Anabaena sp. CCAP 1446/1C]MCM2404544.1 iron ABC transporter permease [Anabaena sp. CCAP 1446/1C]
MQTIFTKHRLLWAILLLSSALVITLLLSLSQGAVSINFSEFYQALMRQGDPIKQTILWDLRLPRIVAALIVGAALGMSGALLQGMLRNSLADPFILGISAGAGLIVIIMIVLQVFPIAIPLAAWLGAILTSGIVIFLGRTGSGISVERLILGGVAVSALFGSVQSTLLLMAEDGQVQIALSWLVGSLNGRGWQEIYTAGPYIIVALLVGCLLARSLNVLALGDDMTVGLGVSLMRSRLLIGGVATLLAAGAVSIGGLIGFVGLVVPHGVRLIVGTDNRFVLPLSALAGAWLLMFADLLSRLGAVELPVGSVTALLGSPLFIWLLYRRSSN